jgi:hypothetical protein
MREALPWLCGLLLAACLAGCGRDEPTLAPVAGRVYYRGQPLTGGTIVFTPDAERGGHGPLACGEIGPDGRFTLHTGPAAGAVPGWHRITVAAIAGSTPLPGKYTDPTQSGQAWEVKAGQSNACDLSLE